MKTFANKIYRVLPLLFFFFFCLSSEAVWGVEDNHPILIISSYNPDSRQTSGNISDFMEEYQRLGGEKPIALENMNCKSFSEAPVWTRRMQALFAKYQGYEKPSLIVLIGQEAWAAYLSMQNTQLADVPVISALSSRNAVRLPREGDSLRTWMPQSVDFFDDFHGSPIMAGFVHEYDVAANIEMIRKLYPRTRHIAFVSDNSYGGVTMQAYMVKEMKKYPDLDLILLDGRVNTIYTITEKIRNLPDDTAILVGTWRVDMNDGYFMRNATYAMMEAAGGIPTFSLSSVGLGYWAIGGVMPAYRPLGKEMARCASRILSEGAGERPIMEVIPNETVFDSEVVEKRGIDVSEFPGELRFVNLPASFYEQYKYQIWTFGVAFFVLVIALLVSLYFYYHTKKLKDELEGSESALRDAKERAEESNRLKSAFLANMSHEIRTPLNSIVGFSDVLSSGEGTEEEKRIYFNIIKTNSDLLLRLINDVLDVSRLEAGRVSFTPERCDVVQECQRTLASVAQVGKNGNRFEFECSEEAVEMSVDTQRLQQVIINLLSNADKFTAEGVITLKLEPDCERGVAIFSVTDTGCGIPLEKQQWVFERFEKLNEYTQGTGLGLSICRLTVEKWGGRIWIDPDYTDGARFFFTLPMVPNP